MNGYCRNCDVVCISREWLADSSSKCEPVLCDAIKTLLQYYIQLGQSSGVGEQSHSWSKWMHRSPLIRQARFFSSSRCICTLCMDGRGCVHTYRVHKVHTCKAYTYCVCPARREGLVPTRSDSVAVNEALTSTGVPKARLDRFKWEAKMISSFGVGLGIPSYDYSGVQWIGRLEVPGSGVVILRRQ